MGQRELAVRDDSNNEVNVVIDDLLGTITNSSLIAQIFARAVVKVVTGIVTGSVQQIVVEIGRAHRQIEVELYSQRVRVEIDKMGIVVQEVSRELLKAELANIPQRMKDEWVDRLYGLMYKELSDIAPSGGVYYK